MRRIAMVAVAMAGLLGCIGEAGAQDERRLKTKLFRDAPYYDPLLAEPRPARIMLLIPAWAKEFPHSLEPGSRFAWQITLGEELPIVTLSDQTADGPLNPGRWGVGLWIPISFHVIEDFKDPSNPIVDTDYRFGFMVKFQKRYEKFGVGVRFVPWNHESTHLGDEYTIFAGQDPAFERINVSYENWEYGLSLEGDGLFSEGDMWKVRHGGRQPWGEDGYYSDHLLGSDEPTLTPSVANFEPSFGTEYRFSEWRSRQIYFSVDFRYQTIYTYHQTPENPEQRQWSSNWQVGRAVPEGVRGVPLKQYFVQAYWGVNPYGQLRSQKDHWSVGLGFVFGM